MVDAMSQQPDWVTAMLDKDLSATEYRVWSYLAWRQGCNSSAWPSQETIAEQLGLTCDGVRKIARRLEQKGWLNITQPQGQGRGHYLRYTTTCPGKTQTMVYPSEQETQTAVETNTYNRTHTKKKKSQLRRVFDHWNSYQFRSVEKSKDGGAPVPIKWRSHRLNRNGTLPRDKADAITRALADYPMEDVCTAIDNYAAVLLGRDYRWTHAWTLTEFLTRHQQGDRKGPLQYCRFLPDEFDASTYLSDTSRVAAVVRGSDGLTVKERAERNLRQRKEATNAG